MAQINFKYFVENFMGVRLLPVYTEDRYAYERLARGYATGDTGSWCHEPLAHSADVRKLASLVATDGGASPRSYNDTRTLLWYMGMMGIEIDTKEPSRVRCWTTARDRLLERPKQVLKLGRWLSLFTDTSYVERIVDKAKIEIWLDMSDVVYRFGGTSKFFKTAYCADVAPGFSGPDVFDSLTASCMQICNAPACGYDCAPYHPTEAYGSGDFVLHTLWNGKGELVARTVARADNPLDGTDVYAVTDKYGYELQRLIVAEHGDPEVDEYDDGACFRGLELRAIEVADGFVCPYLDTGDYVEYDGGSLVVGHGETKPDTSGLVRLYEQCFCDHCEEYVREEDVQYVDSVDSCVCDDCVRRDFFRSEYSGNLFLDDDKVEVYTAPGVTMSAGTDELGDFAFLSDLDEEYWHMDSRIETECGLNVADCEDDVVEIDNLFYVYDTDEYWGARREIQPFLSTYRPTCFLPDDGTPAAKDDDIETVTVYRAHEERYAEVMGIAQARDIGFCSDLTGEFWHRFDMAVTECGRTVSRYDYGVVCMAGRYFMFGTPEYWAARGDTSDARSA